MARLLSLVSVAFIVLIALGTGGAPVTSEIIGLAFFPVGIVIGFGVAWWREGIGGIISVLSLIGFYVWPFAVRGQLPHGPYFFLFTAPSALFLLSWFLTQAHERKRLSER
jgi:hypothetical protein